MNKDNKPSDETKTSYTYFMYVITNIINPHQTNPCSSKIIVSLKIPGRPLKKQIQSGILISQEDTLLTLDYQCTSRGRIRYIHFFTPKIPTATCSFEPTHFSQSSYIYATTIALVFFFNMLNIASINSYIISVFIPARIKLEPLNRLDLFILQRHSAMYEPWQRMKLSNNPRISKELLHMFISRIVIDAT